MVLRTVHHATMQMHHDAYYGACDRDHRGSRQKTKRARDGHSSFAAFAALLLVLQILSATPWIIPAHLS